MAAVYPGSVRIFTGKTDLVDTVLAEHVNTLQEEVTATQQSLGTGLLSSNWSGTYSQPASHASLTARLANIEAGLISTEAGKQDATSAVTLTGTQTLTNKTLTSPAFTGTPTTPTAASGTNNTQVASTAFTTAAISTHNSDRTDVHGITDTSRLVTMDSPQTITGIKTITSPVLTGTPTAPTAPANVNSTQVATTEFVATAVSNHNAVTVAHGVSGAVVGTTNTQTLTNKTLTSPTISSATISSSAISGGSLSNATSITLTGSQPLTSRVRNVTISTSDPSGGNDGDVWLKYTP